MTNARNPYLCSKGKPRTQRSVVVFADILGFTDEMRRAYKSGREKYLLTELRTALDKSYHHLKDTSAEKLDEEEAWATKVFTDNIVIGYPISGRDDAEVEMGDTFMNLGFFQLEMVLAGFFIRGGIAVGELYIDDEIVFGDALIEAYDAERQLARDPRIVLSESALKYLARHLSYYARLETSPQYRDLLKDADGQVFLNYLDIILFAEENHGPFYDELLKHKEMVESKLDEFSSVPRLWSKYVWVAYYHNFFCGLHKRYFDDSHKINMAKLQLHPTPLTKDL